MVKACLNVQKNFAPIVFVEGQRIPVRILEEFWAEGLGRQLTSVLYLRHKMMKYVVAFLLGWLALDVAIWLANPRLDPASGYTDLLLFIGQPLIPLFGLVVALAIRALLQKKSI